MDDNPPRASPVNPWNFTKEEMDLLPLPAKMLDENGSDKPHPELRELERTKTKKAMKRCFEILKGKLKETSIYRKMPGGKAFDYFKRRDITGEPLIKAAKVLQDMAMLYRMKGKMENGNTRKRMLSIINHAALAVGAKVRLQRAQKTNEDAGDQPLTDEQVHLEVEKANIADDSNNESQPSRLERKGHPRLEESQSPNAPTTNIQEQIERANQFIEVIEEDIQKYMNLQSQSKMLRFSEKIHEDIVQLRKERYTYNDEKANGDVDISKVRDIMARTTDAYSSIMKKISEYCLGILEQPPCKFAHIGMGSLARQDVTPFSDFENVILLEDGDHRAEVYDYFRWYAVLFQVVIINLGESPLRNFAIPELNDFSGGKAGDSDWYWDDVMKPGVRFDSSHPFASKIPLGRDPTLKKAFVLELIKPVSDMAMLLCDDDARRSDYMEKGYHISEVLQFTRFVAGNEEVHESFQQKRKEILLERPRDLKPVLQLYEEFTKFFPEMDITKSHKGRHIPDISQPMNHEFRHGSKDIFHRLACCFLTTIGRMKKIHGETLFEFIDGLHKAGVLASRRHMEQLVANIYAWRDSTYLSIGGQEDYCFGTNDGVITSAVLLGTSPYVPNFENMISVLLGCRDFLHSLWTRIDDVSEMMVSKLNLKCENSRAIHEACHLFGFSIANDDSCSSSGSAYALFSALYSAVVTERSNHQFMKMGLNMIWKQQPKATETTGESQTQGAVFSVPSAPTSSSEAQAFKIQPGANPASNPNRIDIPTEVLNRQQATVIHLPQGLSSNQPTAIQVPQADGKVFNIQLTPEMLSGNQITAIPLTNLQNPDESLQKLLSQIGIGNGANAQQFETSAMFSNMVAQGNMKKPRDAFRCDLSNLAATVLKDVRSGDMTNNPDDHSEKETVGSPTDNTAESADKKTLEDSIASTSHAAERSADFGSTGPQPADAPSTEDAKETVKEALAKAALDGSLANKMGAYADGLWKNLLGTGAMAAPGEGNPLMLIQTKMAMPNICFPDLIPVEDRLLLLSELRADQEEYEETVIRKSGSNPFLIPGTSENCVDDIFEFGRLAVMHDGSLQCARECNEAFQKVKTYLSEIGFVSEAMFKMQKQIFDQILRSADYAMTKLENINLA